MTPDETKLSADLHEDMDIFSAMEELRDEYPNEKRTDIWLSDVDGRFSWTCYIPENSLLGTPSAFSGGDTLRAALDEMFQKCPPQSRDPLVLKAKRVKDLERQLAELQGEVTCD